MEKKMWRVHGTVIGGKYLGEFEAKTAKEAVKKALSEAEVSMCHHCSDECEDPEIVSAEAVEVEDDRT